MANLSESNNPVFFQVHFDIQRLAFVSPMSLIYPTFIPSAQEQTMAPNSNAEIEELINLFNLDTSSCMEGMEADSNQKE